jgi:hypothetical protein
MAQRPAVNGNVAEPREGSRILEVRQKVVEARIGPAREADTDYQKKFLDVRAFSCYVSLAVGTQTCLPCDCFYTRVIICATITASSDWRGTTSMSTADRLTMLLGEAIFSLRAIRRLKPDPIPDADLQDILEAAIRAPNGGNTQPWHFVVVKDPDYGRSSARCIMRLGGPSDAMRGYKGPRICHATIDCLCAWPMSSAKSRWLSSSAPRAKGLAPWDR